MISVKGDIVMNFETKYLIRWGIPGWIFLLSLTPYVLILYGEQLTSTISNNNLLVLATFVTLAGVPLGYFFNQIHHLISWVIPRIFKNGWEEYFKDEIKVDNLLSNEKNEQYKERYRYLLSKKHEVGSVLSSFSGAFLIVYFNSISNNMSSFELWYTIVLSILVVGWYFLRKYASANIDLYFDELLKASEN